MAGVGFELKKLFREHGLLQSAKAYVYSSITTVGPMVLCVLLVSVMQGIMLSNHVSYSERELFLTTIVYGFIFSVLLTGGLSMLLTRFIADRIYEKKYEHLLSSYYGAVAVLLPAGALTAWLFLRHVTAGTGYKWAAYFFFIELVVVWIQSVHLSALKDYGRIVRNFAVSVLIAVAGAWLVLRYTDYDSTTAALVMIDVGFFLVIVLTTRHFEQFFRYKDSRLYFLFFSYIRKYPSLLLIGTFFYAGVYIHSFVYWFGSKGMAVAGAYRISPFFDLPVFYAYLTVVPTLVTFVVSVETAFYAKFRDYYTRILNGGTYQDISRARKEMQRVLMQEVGFIMEVQLLFTIVSLALGIKLLPLIGFTMEQLDTFRILVLGYFLFIVAFVVMLLLLYYDDRKGVLTLSAAMVVLNTAFSWWTMDKDYDGFGLFMASFIILMVSLGRLLFYVRSIDYYTFCSQPMIPPVEKQRFWRQLRKKSSALAALLVMVMLLGACATETAEKDSTAEVVAPAVTATDQFVEDKRIYERDDDLSVRTLYVTVLPDDSDGETPETWYNMNRLRERTEEKELPVIFQEGTAEGKGPASGMFGFDETTYNGKIGLRGNSTRFLDQRSYSIKLTDRAGLWRDQRSINLIKSATDPTRIRHKLSYDIFETLPDIGSLRTQFVHLYVKDLSEGSQKEYEDYGLFTQVEQPNKNYLKNHWMDSNGQLYKAISFEFYRYPDELKPETDPFYDKTTFESRLEIKGREEHDKLLKMLDDVNDLSMTIDEVIEKHFDLDNYLTWLAANILMDNMDTISQNYFLYSPLNSEKFYFLPWDYDGGWEIEREEGVSRFNSGISNYWSVILHNRFLRSEKNVELLKDKIDQMYSKYINGSIAAKVDAYRVVVEPFMRRAPDRNFLPVSISQLDNQFKLLSEVPKRSIERFMEDLQKPKPIFLGDVKQNGNTLTFNWDASFDIQGDDLSYDWILSKNPDFTQVIKELKGLKVTSIEVKDIPKGSYYWRVITRDSQGHSQLPFDQEYDDDGKSHYGMRKIKVE
ncbi:exopolysaccharide Pel transporter PelG [Cohnella suwonensis]|uniref:Exopolysaccharide Pel transporter PelG n=1 Tax=Cohnella suwonensis TaxID=696072 RepID=A0ABW0LWU3_9BACL